MSFTFGKPDTNILHSSDVSFKDFTFSTIGKEPGLLKRISNRQEGVRYQDSPSPEPESPEDHNQAKGRTRPSLLQALTDDVPVFDPLQPQPSITEQSSGAVSGHDMDLQYPEADGLPAATLVPRPPSPLHAPPFVPDYPGLKDIYGHLEASYRALALPPPPKKAPTPPPEFASPSLIAANNAVHHTEKTFASAKEAVQASTERVSTFERSVFEAQKVVDSLTQALGAARAVLEAAQLSLAEARRATEEAQSALTASRIAADAAEETKRLLEEPPPPRVLTPAPPNPNEEIISKLKKDLDSMRLWVDLQEAAHLATAAAAERASSREREEEEERETGHMITAPEDSDTDIELLASDARRASGSHEIHGTDYSATQVKNEDTTDAPIDETNCSKNAAQAVVELVALQPSVVPQTVNVDTQDDKSLAREVALRKLQEMRREQVRLKKAQAQAEAAILILKERQDAAKKEPTVQSAARPRDADTSIDVPKPVAADKAQHKAKNSESPTAVPLESEIEPFQPPDPSLVVERAAAPVPHARPVNTQSAPNSKAAGASPKKKRNLSVPPITHLEREPEDISASRTSPDKGNIVIIPRKKAPKLPPNLAADVQLMNLRHVIQDEGLPWEAISRSRPNISDPEEPKQAGRHPAATPISPKGGIASSSAAAAINPPTTPLTLKPLPSRKHSKQLKKAVQPAALKASEAVAGKSNGTVELTRALNSNTEDIVQSGLTNRPSPTAKKAVADLRNNANLSDAVPVPGHPLPRAQAGASSRSGSEVDAPVSDAYRTPAYRRPLTERVGHPRRSSSPLPRPISPSRGRYDPHSIAESSRPPNWDRRVSRGSPPSPSRYTQPRSHLPPRAASPHHAAGPTKRSFSGDHYLPDLRRGSATTSNHVPRRESTPPRGPRQGISRALSNPQKRTREDDYTPVTNPPKRFKGERRDAERASARAVSPPSRSWTTRQPEHGRPALELRLGATPDPGVRSSGRGESYRPEYNPIAPAEHQTSEGLLGRLSDPRPVQAEFVTPNLNLSVRGPNSNQPVRGRGGARGYSRGRGARGRGGGGGGPSLVNRLG